MNNIVNITISGTNGAGKSTMVDYISAAIRRMPVPAGGSAFEIIYAHGDSTQLGIEQAVAGCDRVAVIQEADFHQPLVASRRMVACVDACRGLDTIELEQEGLASAFGNQLLDLEQQVAELSEQLEGQRSLNGSLQVENQTLSARVMSRVEELQQATQARLVAEQQRDELLAAIEGLVSVAMVAKNNDYRHMTNALAAIAKANGEAV